MRSALAALAFLTVVTPCLSARAEPPAVEEEEPDTVAPQYPPPSARWTLLLGGLGSTAAWYGAAVGASYAFPDAAGADDLRVPIAGPWMSLTHTGCPSTDPGCSDAMVAVQAILTVLDGIGQAAGPLLVLESLLMHTQVPAAAPTPRPRPAPAAPPANGPESPGDGNKNLFFLPRPTLMGLGGVGLQVSGTF